MDLKAIEWDVVDQIYRAEDRGKWQTFINTVMKAFIPSKPGNFFVS
jgi:hypothetical protein